MTEEATPQLTVEELYKKLEGCGKVHKTLTELQALAETKEFKEGPEVVLLRHAPVPRSGFQDFATPADMVQFIRENTEGRCWGALEISDKTKLPVFYVWQPPAPKNRLPVDHKVYVRFEREIKDLLHNRIRGDMWVAAHHFSSAYGQQLPCVATIKTAGQYDSKKVVLPFFWAAVVAEVADHLIKTLEGCKGEVRVLCAVLVDSATKGIDFELCIHTKNETL